MIAKARRAMSRSKTMTVRATKRARIKRFHVRQAETMPSFSMRKLKHELLGIVLVSVTSLTYGATAPATDADALLQRADTIKTSNPGEFANILKSLEAQSASLSPTHQALVRYLRAWREAYTGQYERAIAILRPLIAASPDPTIAFRAQATLANVLSVARRYEDAFSELNVLVEKLDSIADPAARDQGLAVAAYLYAVVGQHDLSLMYADKLIAENWNGLGACRGGQIKVRTLYEAPSTHPLRAKLENEIRSGIEACVAVGERMFANLIRSHELRLLIERNELTRALELAKRYHEEVQATRYARLISEFDSLLAELYWRLNEPERAQEYALRSVEGAAKGEFTQPVVDAYQLLYTLAKRRGDVRAALEFHEKYMAADKGYIDDVTARQLAFERVKHEVAANKAEIESLYLQRQLDATVIENTRLYVALLIAILGFIAFWAYKTKRSQLHFMKLSRRDGLTGIFNRPHFMELAESTLENCRKLKQDVALVLFDLDYFKQINDRFGHGEGDTTLKRVVEACQRELRAADVFARLGGEEFCVLLPACDIENAQARAEELRKAMWQLSESSPATISASLGVACTEHSGYDLKQLLAHADVAMYQAKRAGRNRVVVYDRTEIEAHPGLPNDAGSVLGMSA
jgi:diguanylate cyclase (GGDEF)-like protein